VEGGVSGAPVWLAAAGGGAEGLSGLSGWAAGIIEAMGAPGLGLLMLLETVFPPLPSEVVLPLAGYLAEQGELNLPLLLVSATAGSVAGALAFYWLGYRLGEERAERWVGRLPLVEPEDVDRALRWFRRYGSAAVLVGRLVPGIRSLISLPAGATRMPLGRFVALTAAGSALWNGLLLGAGVALGTQWQQVSRYSHVLDLVIIGVLALTVLAGVVRQVRRRSGAAPARRG
jgi:membrane protein DedA with SNARE-associated domain